METKYLEIKAQTLTIAPEGSYIKLLNGEIWQIAAKEITIIMPDQKEFCIEEIANAYLLKKVLV